MQPLFLFALQRLLPLLFLASQLGLALFLLLGGFLDMGHGLRVDVRQLFPDILRFHALDPPCQGMDIPVPVNDAPGAAIAPRQDVAPFFKGCCKGFRAVRLSP